MWLPADGLRIAAGWAYTGPLQAWVARLKSGQLADPHPLLPPMQRLVARLAAGQPVGLVAVAPERSRLIQRGLHLPDLLAGALKRRGVQRVFALERLDASAPRRDGVRTPPEFRVRVRLPDVPLVLVDDVVTTGQTLATAQRALETAGGRVLGAVCLADARPALLARVLAGEG